MKIGILTYHNTRNCGAILQAYALQKALFDLGIPNEIIDYHCEMIDDAYKIKNLSDIKNIKSFVKWLLTIRRDIRTQKKFDEFTKLNLKLSKRYDINDIEMSNKDFDAFIVGSDQVWNFKLNGSDKTYLLNFVKTHKKKISYAASSGSGVFDIVSDEVIKKELNSFDAISVREKSLAEYVDRLIGKKPSIVLDPTLLMPKEKYLFNEETHIPNGKYIFVYTIAPAPNIDKAVKKLLKTNQYTIIWGHMSYKKKMGCVNKTDLSPVEFINYIKNAKYVLTSSFHGMAFSIIMEKQFFYDLDPSKVNNNSRINNLAEILDIQNRKLYAGNINLNIPDIDYVKVKTKLQKEQAKAIDFLKGTITDRR